MKKYNFSNIRHTQTCDVSTWVNIFFMNNQTVMFKHKSCHKRQSATDFLTTRTCYNRSISLPNKTSIFFIPFWIMRLRLPSSWMNPFTMFNLLSIFRISAKSLGIYQVHYDRQFKNLFVISENFRQSLKFLRKLKYLLSQTSIVYNIWYYNSEKVIRCIF